MPPACSWCGQDATHTVATRKPNGRFGDHGYACDTCNNKEVRPYPNLASKRIVKR